VTEGGLAPALSRFIAGPTHDLKRLPIVFDPRAISLAEGVRAALATAVIVAADAWLHWPPMMEAALAALLTCLCDAGGPIRRRVPALLSFAVLGALIVAVFGLARGAGYAIIPLVCMAVFCTSFARVYGQSAQQVGNLLTVVLVLSVDRPMPGLGVAAQQAGAFMGGSLWALLLTMVIWRLHPYLPARRAVADVYRALAAMAGDLRQLLRHAAADEAAWERHARAHRRSVRDAIERARSAVLDTLRMRGAASARAAQSLIRLETADQIFGALIGLSDLLEEHSSPAMRDEAAELLRVLRPVLIVLGHFIVTDRAERLPRLDRAVAGIAAAGAGSGTERLHRFADVIAERLRIAITLAAPSGFLPDLARDARPPLRARLLGPLRANLDWQSAPLRHALRTALVMAPALAITFAWPGPYQHWLIITMVVTLQPYYAMTFQRALERIGGTVLGGALAAGLALVCRTPATIAAALFPLAVISLSFRAASFGLFIAFLTPLIVLLSELGRLGTSELEIAGMRALYTVIGGLLAVAGCLILWPSWEPGRLGAELRAAIAAHGRYAAAELALLLGEVSSDAVEQARRAAGVASNNLEASLARALQEPGQGRRERLQAVMVADAALRRMAGRLSAMQVEPAGDPPSVRVWRDWIADAMRRLSASPPEKLPPRPRLDAGESLARIARQIELMAGALGQGSALDPPGAEPLDLILE
jgi:uncharacterized membrane protein YccC